MAPASPSQRREQAGVLLVGGEDLVAGPQIESADHGVDPVSGRAGQRDVRRPGADRARVALPGLIAQLHQAVEVLTAAAAAERLEVYPAMDGLDGGRRDGTLGAGVEVGQLVEHRELRAKRDCIGGVPGGVGHAVIVRFGRTARRVGRETSSYGTFHVPPQSSDSSSSCSASSRLTTFPVGLRGSSSMNAT